MGCRGSYVASLYVAKGSSKGRYEIFFGICFVYLKKICSKIRRKKKLWDRWDAIGISNIHVAGCCRRKKGMMS
jgi:hypothetical protein